MLALCEKVEPSGVSVRDRVRAASTIQETTLVSRFAWRMRVCPSACARARLWVPWQPPTPTAGNLETQKAMTAGQGNRPNTGDVSFQASLGPFSKRT